MAEAANFNLLENDTFVDTNHEEMEKIIIIIREH